MEKRSDAAAHILWTWRAGDVSPPVNHEVRPSPGDLRLPLAYLCNTRVKSSQKQEKLVPRPTWIVVTIWEAPCQRRPDLLPARKDDVHEADHGRCCRTGCLPRHLRPGPG